MNVPKWIFDYAESAFGPKRHVDQEAEMIPEGAKLTDEELIGVLRRAASTWFKNSDLLLLEELIKRYRFAVGRDVARKKP